MYTSGGITKSTTPLYLASRKEHNWDIEFIVKFPCYIKNVTNYDYFLCWVFDKGSVLIEEINDLDQD